MTVLWFTHSLAAIAGGLVVYLTMTWKGTGVTRDEKHRVKYGVSVLAVAAFIVTIGVQTTLAERDNEDRDRAYARQAECLNDFAADMIATLNTRVAANERLDEARAARDRAADRVIVVVALARRIPPEANEKQFGAALEKFVEAKANVDRVARETKATLANNAYPDPPRTNCGA